MARTHTITPNEIIRDMHRVADKTGGFLSVATYRDNGLFSMLTMQRTLGLENSKQATIMNVINATEKPKADYSPRTLKMLMRKWNKHFKQRREAAEIAGDEKAAKYWKFTRDNFARESLLSKHEVIRVLAGEGGTWTQAVKNCGIAS